MTNERYAVNAMHRAIGALKALKKDGDTLDHVVRHLEVAIEKIGGAEECTHSGALATLDPKTGKHAGHCSRCGGQFTL